MEGYHAMATCVNGHDNPADQNFCGECGVVTRSMTAVCPQGHQVPKGQKFCGSCGGPVSSPVPGAPTGRWAVDPLGRHQYRFFDGNEWSEHVADRGVFNVDPPPRAGISTTERWIGVAAGVVTVVLLAGAVSAIVTQFSPGPESKTMQATVHAPVILPEAAAPAPLPPPEPAAPWPVAVIGSNCRPYSNDAVTADGSVAHCVNLAASDTFLWSLFPDELRVPIGADPSTAVCMAQTGRSGPDCVEYLARPSDPGDGHTVDQ
jgi:serine/threonine protein kinase, bacterial